MFWGYHRDKFVIHLSLLSLDVTGYEIFLLVVHVVDIYRCATRFRTMYGWFC